MLITQQMSSMETLLKLVQRAGEGGLLYVENYLAGQLKQGAAEAAVASKA